MINKSFPFQKINLINSDNYYKIKAKDYEWSILLVDKNKLFDLIIGFIFEKENMFYYLTQKKTTQTIRDTRQYVKKLIKQGNIDAGIKPILVDMGWISNELNISSTIFQGDLSEYIMSIMIDNLNCANTLISKVSLKTSSGSPVYGNDNIYYDYIKKTLYFGESKFYSKLGPALNASLKSLEKHNNIKEISFITNQTSSFIANDKRKLKKVQQIFDKVECENYKHGIISFIIEDEKYAKKDIEEVIKKFANDNVVALSNVVYICIVFPILSKKEFLEYFKLKLVDYESK